MKLSKAIEILELNTQQSDFTRCPDVLDALKLGIAALKHVQQIQASTLALAQSRLPGQYPA